MGTRKDPAAYGNARRTLAGDETFFKNARNYGGSDFQQAPAPVGHPHFGVVLVSCERGDLRPLPSGVMIYSNSTRRLEKLPPPSIPRVEVIDEVVDAILNNVAPRHSGEWALRTLEVCLAIRRSAVEQREIMLVADER
jgi:phthalate 4,5-cis-dihydrodiol dehydrogenase